MFRFHLTLRTRIYLSMMAIILVSFIVTGGIALYDHYEESERYNELRLERKERAVKASMEYFLNQNGGYISSDSVLYAFNDKICELSDVHDLFIAMYDLRGNYLISTNSDLLDSLQAPEFLNYTILKQLITGNQRAVTSKIVGDQQYSYAYWHFKDQDQKPIAVTSVVYENTKMEGNDVFVFLEDLVQSYILLFLMASFVAYLLSTYITSSLQEVGQRMKNVQLGGKNDVLTWESNDEIGALVEQYNRMVRELEKSATLLAQEERESAWREMAKQVAHEIKNPLTPMKLRVQQLQRSWNDKAPEFDQKLKVYVDSMTQQIDALSHIANEFSNFAKMPKPNLQELDIVELTKSTLEIFDNQEQYDFQLRIGSIENPMVTADREQLMRVLINLVTNAIQASKLDSKPYVMVSVRAWKNRIIIRVNDKGVGISEEGKSKIFVPNFTTKSTGTGLGLAMVKSIMIQCGGRVFFWSKEGKGASFYLDFPRSI